MKKIIALSRTEMKNITRDQFLLFITFLPVLLGVICRFGIPAVRQLVLPYFDLQEHYGFIMSFLIMMTPAMYGWVIGFTLLDDRDEDILTYISVTPLKRTGYLAFKIVGPVIFGFLWTYVVLIIAGLTPINFLKLLPVAIMASLEAPIFALVLAAFARNKIEGLAVAKLGGIVFIGPFIGYFIKSNWQILGGIFPTYWISKTYLASGAIYWVSLLVGLVMHGIILVLLLKKFK